MTTKTVINYIWKYVLIKIIIGGLVCILVPILINKILLENLLDYTGVGDNINRAIRSFITTIILMPSLYLFVFRDMKRTKYTEFKLKSVLIPIFSWFTIPIFIIGLLFLLLVITNQIEVTTILIPDLIIVNVILILGLVITEEILFRGILYRIIEERWGTTVALSVSSLVFALFHFTNENISINSILSVIAGGILLGILYSNSRNLVIPIAFHFGWNLSQVILGFGLSGGNEFSHLYLFKLNILGSDVITGGESGIENSVFAIVVLVGMFTYLFNKYSKKQNNKNAILSSIRDVTQKP